MSNIKERVVLIAEYYGVRKMKFFSELGISYAGFKGIQKNTSLNSDAIVTILSKYPSVNAEWLVTGTGAMLRDQGELARDRNEIYDQPVVVNEVEQTLIEVLKMVITTQEKTISSLEKQIAILEEKLRLP